MGDDKSLLWSLVILLYVKSSLGTAGRSVSCPAAPGAMRSAAPQQSQPEEIPVVHHFLGLMAVPQGRLEPALETQGAPSKPPWLFLCPKFPGGPEWVNSSPWHWGWVCSTFPPSSLHFYLPDRERGRRTEVFHSRSSWQGWHTSSMSFTCFFTPCSG